MNMEGMLALLHSVERINFKKLKMRNWYTHRGSTRFAKVPHKRRDGTPGLGCGTSACWLGQAACDPKFRKVTGIKLELTHGQFVAPRMGAYSGMDAAMQGLDISRKQAEYLFGSLQSGKKEDLIRRWWNVVSRVVE